MKRSILLFTACLIAGFTNGQEAVKSVLFQPLSNPNVQQVQLNGNTKSRFTSQNLSEPPGGSVNNSGAAHKTTTTPPRWYNFGLMEDTILTVTNAGYSASYLWFTDKSVFYYTGGYLTNNEVSDGTIFDPMAPGFNDIGYYPGLLAVNATNGYTVDSVSLQGFYKRNPANSTDVDTLRIAYTYGNGATGSNIAGYRTWGFLAHYGIDTLKFLTLYFDSLINTAVPVTGGTVPVYTQDILLHQTDTPGSYFTTVKLTNSLNVPAGNKVGLSVTFKSGNPLADAYSTFADTIRKSDGSNKYGGYRQEYVYNNTGSALGWPQYQGPAGWNVALTQLEPSARNPGQLVYMASYELTTNSGADPTTDQYPLIGFHVVCPSCPTVTPALNVSNVTDLTSIKAYPNPAGDQLNISFTLAQNATASVTLTNMVGQVVSTQNVTNGKAIFNTSALPAGLYIYTVQANGDRVTGRVVIVH